MWRESNTSLPVALNVFIKLDIPVHSIQWPSRQTSERQQNLVFITAGLKILTDMDPLSILGFVAGLSTATRTISAGVRWVTSLKNVPLEFFDLQNEVRFVFV